MKNLTITIDEQAYQRARVYAAHQGKSLSGLVRELLERIQEYGDNSKERSKGLLRAMASVKAPLKASSRLKRSVLHER